MSKKLIMSFLLCIALVGCGKTEKVNTSVSDAPDPDYVKNYFENYDPSEHETTSELKELEFNDTSKYDDWRSLKCSIAGIDIQLPTTFDYLEQHGWSVEKSEDYGQDYYMELSDDYLFAQSPLLTSRTFTETDKKESIISNQSGLQKNSPPIIFNEPM